MPDCGQHAAHLPVAPFKDRQLDLGAAVVVGFVRGRAAGPGRRRRHAGAHRPNCNIFRAPCRAVVEHDSSAQAAQGIGGRHAAHFGPVGLGHMVLGVRHLVQEVAVVGEKDQAFAFLVQPPDRAQHGARRQFHQIRDQVRGMHVAAGRNHAARLVERNIVMLGWRVNAAPFKRDPVHARLDFHAHLGHDLAVDFDAPFLDPHFTRPAGPDPGLGEPLLQTHGRGGRRFGRAQPARSGTRANGGVEGFVGSLFGHSS